MKVLGAFYQRDSKCKECRKILIRHYRAENIDKIREYDRERGKTPKRIDKHKRYIRTEGGRAAKSRGQKAYEQREPIRYKAQYTFGNAVRDGKIRRECICEECLGFDKVEGHHDDYRFPLEVRWLCEECHKDWHRKHDPIYS